MLTSSRLCARLQLGCLTQLTRLDVSYNRLGADPAVKALPDSIDGCVSLASCSLRHNTLSSDDLPPALGSMQSLTYLDVSNNRLAYIPECITDCESIVKLVLNTNQLEEVPDALVFMPHLQTLHVANNRIREIPAEIGSLGNTLAALKLDWNLIEELPPSFSALASLREFTTEGCPMRIPGQHVILRGPDAVRRWCETSTDSTVFRLRQRPCCHTHLPNAAAVMLTWRCECGMTGIVRGLQLVCEQALKYKLVDPAFLVPDLERVSESGKRLAYYGVVTETLTSHVGRADWSPPHAFMRPRTC